MSSRTLTHILSACAFLHGDTWKKNPSYRGDIKRDLSCKVSCHRCLRKRAGCHRLPHRLPHRLRRLVGANLSKRSLVRGAFVGDRLPREWHPKNFGLVLSLLQRASRCASFATPYIGRGLISVFASFVVHKHVC